MNIPSEEQKQYAKALCASRECPNCKHKITLFQIFCMLRGGGFSFYIKALWQDGEEYITPEAKFNPQTMVLIEH